jgi:predicted dehydrogenase
LCHIEGIYVSSEITSRHHRHWLVCGDRPDSQAEGNSRVEIVAIARRSAERLALAQQALNVREAFTDWREMLEKAH